MRADARANPFGQQLREDPVEFCEMRHGYCACAKLNEVVCLQILRLVEDPVETQRARRLNQERDEKRRSRYIKDEPRYGGTLRDHQIQMLEAARRLMGSEMLVPTIPSKSRVYERMYRGVEKTASQVAIEKYSRDDAMFTVDYSEIEARMMDHLRKKFPIGPSPRERRLGSSEKPHVKFLPDPVKEKPR